MSKRKLDIDIVKETKRASRAVLSETMRGRKSGSHKTPRKPKPNEYTEEEVDEFLGDDEE